MKVLVAILAYNAQNHITNVLERLEKSYIKETSNSFEVVIFDDASQDQTTTTAKEFFKGKDYPYKILHNPINLGYGGNQKIAFHYAISHDFDTIVILHGDGQYPPEQISNLIEHYDDNSVKAVFGSRMINRQNALKGGMPFYKYVGNIVLTKIQNYFLGVKLSEFHSGFRSYQVSALKTLPFEYNSSDFDFDTDIIIQLSDNHYTIKEIPIATHYGDEICHVNGIKYALQIMRSTYLSRVQHLGIYYSPKFDYQPNNPGYQPKTDFDSSHSFAIDRVKDGSTVIDFGCANGYVAQKLNERQCKVYGFDSHIDKHAKQHFVTCTKTNLDNFDFKKIANIKADYILLLDVVEHLLEPEKFLQQLRQATSHYRPVIIFTTGNIGFITMRLSLLIGNFNYGKRGILDMTHKRLFTKKTLKKTIQENGYQIREFKGVAIPFPFIVKNSTIAGWLTSINNGLIKLSKGLFSFQLAVIAKPIPTVDVLLNNAAKDDASHVSVKSEDSLT